MVCALQAQTAFIGFGSPRVFGLQSVFAGALLESWLGLPSGPRGVTHLPLLPGRGAFGFF